MRCSRPRSLAFWRGFLAAPGPLPRRLLGLVLALLPLPLRRPLLRVLGVRWPGWLARSVFALLGYLLVCAFAALALWLLSLVGPWLCASSVLSCSPVTHSEGSPW
ncbi:hypothetical protein [Thiocystis violacea]|uniref:hypothetical protein n=1 Tax=Thiocystis violacea TaxID=13725 RepID=UPI0019039C68|nr:hypothetical protein [Thiocystis violacea]MBK1722818.1 hypothetical protein [Thiocystis violacea]